MQSGDGKKFEYMPSISIAGSTKWTNHTSWIENTEYRFSKLHPFTTYNITVYVRVNGTEHVDPPYLYINVTTAEGIPTAPLNVNVTQLNGSRVQVSWDAPSEIFGILKEYTVYYGIQSSNVHPASSVKVSPQERSIVLESNFEANSSYNFWVSSLNVRIAKVRRGLLTVFKLFFNSGICFQVRARNSKNESPSSSLARLSFDDVSNIDRLSGLQTTNIGHDFIILKWNAIKAVDGYIVQPVLPQPYPKLPVIRTTEPTAQLNNLVPGAHINIKVSAYVKNYFGRVSSISVVLPGLPLPEVPQTSLFHDGTSTRLKWHKPNTTLQNLTYGIYYGTTLEELYESNFF